MATDKEKKLLTAVGDAIADAIRDDFIRLDDSDRDRAARAAVKAMTDWMQADLIEAMERGGYRP